MTASSSGAGWIVTGPITSRDSLPAWPPRWPSTTSVATQFPTRSTPPWHGRSHCLVMPLNSHQAFKATDTFLDLGAGTGLIALAAAHVCRRVVAVDVSAPMLEHLRSRVTQLGIANVECVHGGFLTYQQQGQPADFVHSRNALHHLPDFWKGIA